MRGALIRRIALMVLVCAVSGHAVIGDLNLDGVVDLQDFFILADNFGREGAPEVCEDPDTPGDDRGSGPILDADGDSTTLALASFNIRIFSTNDLLIQQETPFEQSTRTTDLQP